MPNTEQTFAPMEAKLVSALPREEGWQFEPKWDGFRCLAFRKGEAITLLSKSGKDLGRHFPEIVSMLAAITEPRFILDGELILPIADILSFDALQQRLHPAPSRIARLSRTTPAQYMLFDCLGLGNAALTDRPLHDRRATLERFHATYGNASLLLSPRTNKIDEALAWLARSGGALDGVIAKQLDDPYYPGKRAMLKVKQHRSADCVVGGVRRQKEGGGIASLLLGLYNDDGLLDQFGFTSAIKDEARGAIDKQVAPLLGGSGFTGKAPGGPSRWNTGATSEWESLAPELVVEVLYDQVTGNRFRHGTRLMRWRPDKAASQCRLDQLVVELRAEDVNTVIVRDG